MQTNKRKRISLLVSDTAWGEGKVEGGGGGGGGAEVFQCSQKFLFFLSNHAVERALAITKLPSTKAKFLQSIRQ